MDTQLMIQSTPNPNALKFVLNKTVKTEGNFTYKNASECENNPMAKTIFNLNSAIHEVYFFDNYVTVTQDGNADWDDMEEEIRKTILGMIDEHDPNFKTEEPKQEAPVAAASGPEIEKINAILDQTVRPALQMDGGDIQLLEYSKDKQLKVLYQGACGSCPSSSSGTLVAIENILRDQFDPEITVTMDGA